MILTPILISQVFPEFQDKPIKDCLLECDYNTLLLSIGFFANPRVQEKGLMLSDENLKEYVISKLKELHIDIDRAMIYSRQSHLLITESILEYKEEILNHPTNTESQELNILLAFLISNELLFNRFQLDSTTSDLSLGLAWTLVHLSMLKGSEGELWRDKSKLPAVIYTTSYKLKAFIEFLEGFEVAEVRTSIYKSSNTSNSDELFQHYKNLLKVIVEFDKTGKYQFRANTIPEFNGFLESLKSIKFKSDDDFTFLKKNPVIQTDKDVYTIVDNYFLLDSFVRGMKFKFFRAMDGCKLDGPGTYSQEFAEDYLFSKVIKRLFDSQSIKWLPSIQHTFPHDGCFIFQGTVFVFEFKDGLIDKKTREQNNIETIKKALTSKFIHDGEKGVGIKQLEGYCSAILSRSTGLNEIDLGIDFNIVPILVCSERTFNAAGLNYSLNSFFKINNQRVLPPTLITLDWLILRGSHGTIPIPDFISLLTEYQQKHNTHSDSRNLEDHLALLTSFDNHNPVNVNRDAFIEILGLSK